MGDAPNDKAPRPRRVPGVPLFGNTFQFLRDTSGLLHDAYRRYGAVYRLRALWLKYTVIAGFEAKDFLQKGLAEEYLSRHAIFDAVGEQLGSADFVLAQSGEKHHRFRRVLSLVYSREVASPFVPAFIEATREYIRCWKQGDRLPVMDHIRVIAFDQYCRAMCGRSLLNHARDCLLVTDYNMNIGGRVWPFLLFKAPWYKAARKRVLDLMWSMVRERRGQSAPDGPPTILDALLTLPDKSGKLLTDDEAVCYSMYGFAGSASYMSRLVGFMLYEILADPDLRGKLVAEVDHAFSRGLNNASDVRGMALLRAVYNETLRFHPVSQGMPFLADRDFTYAGKRVCSGDITVLSQVPMSFDARSFSKPECFDPSRMLEPRNEHRHSGAFHPFGIAHRTCTAMGLVEQMAMTMVATLLHELELAKSPADYRLRLSVKPLPAPDSRFRLAVLRRRASEDRRGSVTRIAEEHITAQFHGGEFAAVQDALQRAARRVCKPGEVVIREGDAADNFYLIASGTARVSRSRDGGETELALLRAGQYFGEIGLLYGVPRTATVTAVDSLELMALSRADFLDIIADSDLLSDEIAGTMRKRLAHSRLVEAMPKLRAAGFARDMPEFQSETRQAGEVIIRAGDEADRFFLIIEGEVVVSRPMPDGATREIARLGAGQYFGEVGLLNGGPRTATLTVAGPGPAMLLSTDRDGFRQMLERTGGAHGDLAQAMLERMAAYR